jgi:hypothetical protein
LVARAPKLTEQGFRSTGKGGNGVRSETVQSSWGLEFHGPKEWGFLEISEVNKYASI